MAQHVLLPNADAKLGANWTTEPGGSTAWSCLESVPTGRVYTTATGSTDSTKELRLDFTTFTLAAGESVTSVVAYMRCVTPSSPAKSLWASLLDNTTSRGGIQMSGGHTLAAVPSITATGTWTQANIDGLKLAFFPGDEGSGQVAPHQAHIVVNTTGGPPFAYDALATKRIRQDNSGQNFTNGFDSGISALAGPQSGDEWETVVLPPVGGNFRTLWIIGDGVWCDGPGVSRGGGDPTHGPVCHSIFGIQTGRDMTNPATTFDWYPGVSNPGGEGEFIGAFQSPALVDKTPYYRWPQAGIVLDDEVLLISGQLMQTWPGSGSAESVGTYMTRYTNITDTPDNWVEESPDLPMERIWRNQHLFPYFNGQGNDPMFGLSDIGDGYIYGFYSQVWPGLGSPPGIFTVTDAWGAMRFNRAAAKAPGPFPAPEWWDGVNWISDQAFQLSNGRSYLRRKRASVKLYNEPPNPGGPGRTPPEPDISFLMTFGSIFKRPDSQWMLTGIDYYQKHLWYANKSSLTGPFSPLVDAGPIDQIFLGVSVYGGLQHWEQTWPGKGLTDVMISHTVSGPITKLQNGWPAIYRLTGT